MAEASTGEGLRLRKVHTRKASQEPLASLEKANGGAGDAGGDALEECPVSPTGRLFLHPDFYTVILCALEFQDRMELQELRRILEGTLAKHPRFHSRVEFPKRGSQRWVPVKIDITRHVNEAVLLPEEAADPMTAVERFMGRAVGLPPLDPLLPLWEALLIHAPRPRSASACILRIHHALGDGTSLMSLLLACTRQTSNPTLLPNLPGAATRLPPLHASSPTALGAGANEAAAESAPVAAAGGALPSEESSETLDAMATSVGLSAHVHAPQGERAAHKAGRGRAGVVASVGRAVTVAWNSVCHISRFLAVVTVLPDSQTVLKAGPGLLRAPKRVTVTPDMSLLEVSDVRKACGATVNDVMLTILTLAAEKYLQRRYEEGSSPEPPRRPRVTASGLVNLRRSPGLQELSAMMEEGLSGSKARRKAPWGNYMGTYLLPLPMAPRHGAARGEAEAQAPARKENSRETLRAVKRMCDSKKLSLEAHWTYLNGKIVVGLAGGKGAALLLGRLTNQTTMSVSNMLGPLEQVSLGGNPVTAITPTVPPPNQALCCHFQSYNGSLKVVLYTCTENFPDPEQFSSCFIDAFEDLKASVL